MISLNQLIKIIHVSRDLYLYTEIVPN